MNFWLRVKTQTAETFENPGSHRAGFVPHEFIQSLGRHGITDLALGDMVERNVHVMFSDIRDYTTLCRRDMNPAENFKICQFLADKVGPVVKRNNGIINQYLGDTIMTLFV
jgi:class 3 adenylate cyclase